MGGVVAEKHSPTFQVFRCDMFINIRTQQQIIAKAIALCVSRVEECNIRSVRSYVGFCSVRPFISHYLRNLCFVPSSLRTKANADGSFSSGQQQQQGCREKEWRLSERVGTSRYLVHFFASLITCLHFLSCSMQCRVYSMVGTCRAQVNSLLQTFFSIDFFACER